MLGNIDVGMENADNWNVSRWWFDVGTYQRAIQGALPTRVVEVMGFSQVEGRRFRGCESSVVFEEQVYWD